MNGSCNCIATSKHVVCNVSSLNSILPGTASGGAAGGLSSAE